ncbi:MAG: hypothetical protein ABEJ67_00175 [Halanaeroarchaeum sp.]
MGRTNRRTAATVITVVGDGAESVADRIRTAEDDATVVSGERPEEADLLVAVGESALLNAVREGTACDVLPVDVGAGVPDVALRDLEAAVRAVREGERTVDERSLLAAAVGNVTHHGLMDVMAVTSESAKISEFAVETRRAGSWQTVDRVRADGIVVATPAGTPGYGSAAGGPVLSSTLAAVAVVPVGPFRVERSHWVLSLPSRVTVARDETPVSLLVDDEETGPVPAHEPITLDWGPAVTFLRTDVSRSPFERP